MDDPDRKQLADFLRATAIGGHKRLIRATNPNTRVRFVFSLQGTSRSKEGYGYSTVLSADLNPRLCLTHKIGYGG